MKNDIPTGPDHKVRNTVILVLTIIVAVAGAIIGVLQGANP